jgi:hypothetical protein
MIKIKNAKTLPERFFGLHMAEGVAEYREPGKDPYRIFVNESTIKSMDASFTGRPIYVHHVDSVDVANIQEEADGYVVKSFYNAVDGKHWVEFLIVSDEGKEAIKMKKWKLSNAYVPKEFKGGGHWHGIEYQKEVVKGEYEHLAIVPNPRYAESIILTPEEFQFYNSEKELELKRLANSTSTKPTKEKNSMFNFFMRTKVQNSDEQKYTQAEFETMSVTLPKSKKEITVGEALHNMDQQSMKGCYANTEHMVKVGNEEMSVGDLVNRHMELMAKMLPLTRQKKSPK